MLRTPRIFDRRGTRWILQALSPATVVVLVHRGRRSGRIYSTPVDVVVDRPEAGDFVVSPMFGRSADWYQNVVSGGLVEVHVGAATKRVQWRELDEAERRGAIDAYRRAHPVYSKIILRMLVRVNRLDGDVGEAVARDIPMLALSGVDASTAS